MSRRLLDTNFIVRHLVQDHAAHAEVAKRFFALTDRGEATGVILPPVLAECVFVLSSFYKQPRPLIASRLGTLVTAPNIVAEPLNVSLDALRLYGSSKCHFIDCYVAATALHHGYSVATFDSDFFRLTGVTVDIN